MGNKFVILLSIMAVLAALILSPLPIQGAGIITLPRTGQMKCWNTAGQEINCQTADGLGQDGDKQAGVAWPSPRFTDHLDGTVTDNLTGLMWLKNANCLGTSYPGFDTDGTAGDGAVLWQHALDFVAGINAGTYPDCRAGRTDWRLPNRVELASLIDRSRWNPALSEGAPFVHVRVDGTSTAYWSSSTVFTADTGYAWVVYSWDGLISTNNKVADAAGVVPFVWPVRGTSDGPARLPRTGQTTSYAAGDDGALQKGAAWPTPRFTDHNNGTVTDNLTGLIWLKDGTCVEGAGTSNWANALIFVNLLQTGQCSLNDGSSAGQWRLPNVNEIQSLAHTGMWEIGNWLNTQGFTGVERGWYWTSTSFPGDTKKLWDMNFIDGHIQDGPIDKSYGSDYVWAVRGGSGPGLATVTTTPVTGITKTTASGGGNVTSDGGTSVTARGVCWGMLPNPTTADSHTSDGTGTGVFTSSITGLTENTAYHVRSYATNPAGTSYGGDTPFRTGHNAPFAYITNMSGNTVSVIDTAANITVGSPIPVGNSPTGVAVNPSGTRVYVANLASDTVSVIDTATNTVVGPAIAVGDGPRGIAVNPAGTRVYVANQNGDSVSVIDTATSGVGSPITVGDFPWGVAVNPAGTRVYVSNWLGNSVSVIDTSTNTVLGSPIAVGERPRGIVVTPSGSRVYVANNISDTVSVIDTETNTVVGTPIPVGDGPYGIAVNPAGTRVYVTNNIGDTVSVIDAATNTVSGAPIAVGAAPVGIAVNPPGTRVYVANSSGNTVTVIDTATNTVTSAAIAVGSSPNAFGAFIQPQVLSVPTVSTAGVTAITQTSAASGGNVTVDSGATVTARGVCWGTSDNPIFGPGCTSNGTGLGTFTSSIIGLSPYTFYHVRAYATNSAGTGYGNNVSFNTLCPDYVAKIGTTPYDTLQGAINSVAGTAEIRAVAGVREGSLSISGDKTITLLGGYDCVCEAVTGITTVHGSIAVGAGAVVTMGNVAVY
jgi:YVTN family beta-propeller protein